jgi:Phage integrase family
VPIAALLRDYLTEHRARRGSGGLIFGRGGDRPFCGSTIGSRARRAWKAAGLEPIGLHECRHTFASLMIAADVNAKALSTYMGPREGRDHPRSVRAPFSRATRRRPPGCWTPTYPRTARTALARLTVTRSVTRKPTLIRPSLETRSSMGNPTARRGGRAVECGGLENR